MSDHPPIVYVVEDQICAGTLQDYADAYAQAHYAGLAMRGPWILRVSVSAGEPWLQKVTPTVRARENDDYRFVDLQLGEETAHYRIDLRA